MSDRKIDNQRLRNLTTGIIHTTEKDLLEDAGYIMRKYGLIKEDMRCILKAIKPFLRTHIEDPKFWNGKRDESHTGTTEIPQMTDAEKEFCNEIYLPCPVRR